MRRPETILKISPETILKISLILFALGLLLGVTSADAQGTEHPRRVTFANLPADPSSSGSVLYVVTDSDSCTSDTAGTYVLCYWTGSAYAAVGSGGGGGSGDITAVGDCATGDCFQSETARFAFLAPAAGGIATFRAIVEADISDLSHTTDTTLSEEQVEDFVGGMVTGNTETGIAVTYQDADGTLDFVAEVTQSEFDTHEGNASIHHTATVDTDTTCNDVGVVCLFAASASEGGAATTATALAADGADCAAGSYPLGVDASGAAASCTDATTEIDSAISTHTGNASAHHTATVDTNTNASTECSGTTTYLDGEGGCDDISGVYAAASHASTHAENAADELFAENLGTACTVDQIVGSDGSGGLSCTTPGNLETVRKGSAGTITKGQAVYVSGYNVGGWLEVEECDADNASAMPCIGLAYESITNAANARIILSGVLADVDTSSWTAGDELWVSATAGTLTNSKPTGATATVQQVGIVGRSHAVNGAITVAVASGGAVIPNIASANFWLGNGSGVATAVTMSGDATMDNAGAVTVAGGTTTSIDYDTDANPEVSSDGTVVTFDPDDDGVTEADVADGTSGIHGYRIFAPGMTSVNWSSHDAAFASDFAGGLFGAADLAGGTKLYGVTDATTGTPALHLLGYRGATAATDYGLRIDLYEHDGGTSVQAMSTGKLFSLLNGGTEGMTLLSDWDLAILSGIRLASISQASASCAEVDSDRWYADQDCDDVKDAGEGYFDEGKRLNYDADANAEVNPDGTTIDMDPDDDGNIEVEFGNTKVETMDDSVLILMSDTTADIPDLSSTLAQFNGDRFASISNNLPLPAEGGLYFGGAAGEAQGVVFFGASRQASTHAPVRVVGVEHDGGTGVQSPGAGELLMEVTDLAGYKFVILGGGDVFLPAEGASLIAETSTTIFTMYDEYVKTSVPRVDDADADTIADSGDANPALHTLTPTRSFVTLSCSDTDGCTITMGETGIQSGQVVRIVNTSANNCTFADTSGVSELAGAMTMGQYDSLTLLYVTDRWVETSRSYN